MGNASGVDEINAEVLRRVEWMLLVLLYCANMLYNSQENRDDFVSFR